MDFNKFAKILASVAIFGQGMYYSTVQPGPMDLINGAIGGMVFYAIWFAVERKHPQDAALKKIAEGNTEK